MKSTIVLTALLSCVLCCQQSNSFSPSALPRLYPQSAVVATPTLYQQCQCQRQRQLHHGTQLSTWRLKLDNPRFTKLHSSNNDNNNENQSQSSSSSDQSESQSSSSSQQQTQESNAHVTLSQKARRDEDTRRQTRQTSGFATPGISSAIPGARNYEINVERTQKEYLASLGIVDYNDESNYNNYDNNSNGNDNDNDNNNDNGNNAMTSYESYDEAAIDKYVAIHTERGLSHLRMLRLLPASHSFAQVYRLKPDAYLWQDGLVKYYLGDYHGAATSLARNAVRYEARFYGEAASEERIWRDASELKIVSSLNGGRRVKDGSGIPVAMRVEDARRESEAAEVVADGDDDSSDGDIIEGSDVNMDMDVEELEMESIMNERRKVIRLARQLFSSSLRRNSAGVALARAQLQAMCDNTNKPPSKYQLNDPKLYHLHSYFYLGLHYDAIGQLKESKKCMKMALKACANSISGNNQDITYLLPVIHMTVRDWYDDDELNLEEEDDDDNNDNEHNDQGGGGGRWGDMKETIDITAEGMNTRRERIEKKNDINSKATPDQLVQSIRRSIQDLRVVDLREELKKRKLKVGGSKKELQKRLINDLKKDAGIAE